MRRVCFILSLVMILFACALSVAAQQTGKALTNDDVISMVKNLLPESVILSAIKTNDPNFDISATGLIALKKAGVSAKVMEAMLNAANSKKAAGGAPPSTPGNPGATGQASNAAAFAGSAPATAGAPAAAATSAAGTPAWQPTVSFPQGSTNVNLVAEATEIVQTKSKPTSLNSLAADQALNEALNLGVQAAQQALMKSGSVMGNSAISSGTNILGGILSHRPKQAKVTYVWALTGGNSPANVDGNRPTFEVNYAGIPGVSADQFEPVIVKLSPTPQSNFRLVGATEAATTAEQSTQQDWPIYSSFVEDRVPATVQKVSPGHAKFIPTAALSPGQYAVALRPADKSHKFSGEEVAKNQGEGLLFNYAWSFSVK